MLLGLAGVGYWSFTGGINRQLAFSLTGKWNQR